MRTRKTIAADTNFTSRRQALRAIGAALAGGSVGAALGCSADGAPEDAARAMEAVLAQLPLPKRLGDVGVTADEIEDIAAATMGDYMMANLPATMTARDVEALLRAAL